MSMKNSSDTIGNRTRDLPSWSAVPQLTALPRAPAVMNRSKNALKDTLLNPLNAKLNPICHLLALLGTRPFFHVSRIRVNIEEEARRRGLLVNESKTKYMQVARAVSNDEHLCCGQHKC